MNDSMRIGDQFAVKLECGHPNKNAGELCELCNQTVQSTAVQPKELAGQELKDPAQ